MTGMRKIEAAALITLAIVLIMFVVKEPKITGMTVLDLGKAEIDSKVIDMIHETGEANVIVFLEEPKEKDKKDLKQKKEKIQDIQDDVLSDIDYKDAIGKKAEKKEKSIKELVLKHRYETVSSFSGTVDAEGLEKLSRNPKVKRISAVEEMKISLPESVPLVNATRVHQMNIGGYNLTGSGQTICVIDTGVDYDLPDLGGGWGNRVLDGYDFVNDDTDPDDDNGHGTHVAGIAAANGTFTGMAPDANIIAIKVCNENGSCSNANVTAGIDWCVNNASKYNISVITMSLGRGGPYNTYCNGASEVPYINAAIEEGIIVTVSSGNDGWTNGISIPACIENATSVGSVNDGSSGTTADDVSSFTNSGDTLDLLAPGKWITSTVPPASKCNGDPAERLCSDTGSITIAGTSMAAPHAAGAAALIYQYERLLNGRNATPLEVRQILKNTGFTITRGSDTFPRIDVLAAINSIHRINESENSVEDLDRKARIVYKTATDLRKASEAFVISDDFVSLDSSSYPELNKPANITFYNLGFNKTPAVLKDRAVCISPQCNITSYDGNFTFSVSGFSNYTAGINSQLSIFDDVDNGTEKRTYENVSFYANYTNRTSGEPISGADCIINISGSTGAVMAFEGGLFRYNRTFNTAGLYSYNITCNHTEFETLNTSDDITILPGCGLPSPGSDWNITENTTVVCSAENLFFQEQNLIIGANATFILNNSILKMNQSSTDYQIIVNETGNLTIISSVINSSTADNFNIKVYGSAYIRNSTFGKSQLDLDNSNTNWVYNSTFLDDVTAQNESLNYIYDSNFTATSYFTQNSENLIEDCNFSAAYFRIDAVSSLNSSYADSMRLQGNSNTTISGSTINSLFLERLVSRTAPSVNFTLPASRITTQLSFEYNPVISGYVDMPETGVLSDVTLAMTRYYPIQANYSNSSPVNHTQVNVTNNSAIIWSGFTDENGLAMAVIKYSDLNYTENFTVKVNPTDNISLLSDTPLEFTVDSSGPLIDVKSPGNNTLDADGSLAFRYNATDDTGIGNCSLYFNTRLNQTNTTVVEGSDQYFRLNAERGDYNWSILCYDNSTEIRSSQTGLYNIEVSVCGDGVKSGNEQCDGSDLGGETCITRGYDTGTLLCKSNCLFNTTKCSDNSGSGSGSGSGGGGGSGGSTLASENSTVTKAYINRVCLEEDQETYFYIKYDHKTTVKLLNITDGVIVLVGQEESTFHTENQTISFDSDNNGMDDVEVIFYEESDEKACFWFYELREQAKTPAEEPAEPVQPEETKPAEAEDIAGRAIQPVIEAPKPIKWIWFLIPILFIPLLFLIPLRTIFTEENVLLEMIREDRHRRYWRIHVIERVHHRYRHHKNVRFIRYDEKKHKPIIDFLKKEYEIEDELAELIALASHRMFATVFTRQKVPEGIKKRFRRIRFLDPFEKK